MTEQTRARRRSNIALAMWTVAVAIWAYLAINALVKGSALTVAGSTGMALLSMAALIGANVRHGDLIATHRIIPSG